MQNLLKINFIFESPFHELFLMLLIRFIIGYREEINRPDFFIYCDLSLKKNCRQMKSQSFVWKSLSGNLWFRRKKLNLQFRRIPSLRNSCKTCCSVSQEERSQPNYGFNAARITTRPFISSLYFSDKLWKASEERKITIRNNKMVLWWYFLVIFIMFGHFYYSFNLFLLFMLIVVSWSNSWQPVF